MVFTFGKFLDTLVKLSYLYVRRSEDLMSQIELPSETFVLLLEKLEIKTNKPNISKITLLPSEQVIQLIEDARHGNAEAVIEHIRS